MAAAGIVAGGTGSRMGGNMPKQFLDLCGKPVMVHTVERFLESPFISAVIVGVNPDWYDYMQGLIKQYFPEKVFLTKGGSDRNGTIVNIINYAKQELGMRDDEILVTHDAVRPFVTERMIEESIAALENCDICTAAVQATDTMVISSDGKNADDFPDRSLMYRVQTPQTFRMGGFISMLETVSPQMREKITDACSLFKMNGKTVRIICGEESNIKLTYPADFRMAEAIANL